MKIFVAILTAVVLLTACKDDNWWGDGPEPNSGVFVFEEAQTIVEVNDQTEFFRLKGRYLEPADKKHFGSVFIEFVESSSTAEPNVHFKYEFGTTSFTEGENKIMYADVPIYPEKITEEIKITYRIVPTSYEADKYPNAIRETTIILRPAAKQ